MKANDIYWILKVVTDHYKIDFNISRLKGKNIHDFPSGAANPILTFTNYITDLSKPLNLSTVKYEFSKEELNRFLSNISSPVHSFGNNNHSPLIIKYSNGNKILLQLEENVSKEVSFEELSELLYDKNGKYFLMEFFPVTSLFSDTDESETGKVSSLKGNPIKRFFRLLSLEKKDIGYIYIYALMAGLVYLSLPLGIQAIIGLIMSGQISTSVIVLVVFVLLGILVNGGLQIMQISLIEYLQRRLFTKAAFEFSFRIPKIRLEAILKEYAPELMNRFFDILSVQKGLSKLLLDFSTASLQIFFGLFLLSFYHPFFIFFGFFLLLVLFVIIKITGPKGMETSMEKSKYKYQVAHWLEELARTVNTFKLAGFTNLPLEKTDQVMNNYLTARKSHFKILLFQYYNIVGFKMLVTGGLLILGSLLVIEKEINIGQFVAAEIIIILIINAVEKMIMSLDVIYDVLTAVEKLGSVTDLPIEESNGFYVQQFSKENTGLSIKVKNLEYKFPDQNDPILKGIDLNIKQSQRVCISGYNGSGKSTLINVLFGLYDTYKGEISYDEVSLKDININSLRWHIGDNLSQEDIFEGTLMENITLGRDNITIENILWATEAAGLGDFIKNLQKGFQHSMIAGGKGMSGSIIKKIIIARSIVHKPKLLILNDNNLNFERTDKKKILEFIFDKKFTWTVLIISNDVNVMRMSDQIVVMRSGKILEQGDFNDISKGDHYKSLVIN